MIKREEKGCVEGWTWLRYTISTSSDDAGTEPERGTKRCVQIWVAALISNTSRCEMFTAPTSYVLAHAGAQLV